MTRRARRLLWGGLFVAAVCVVFVRWQFRRDPAAATAHAAQGSQVLTTRCGPIEAQQVGTGLPLLMVHGSGGGHDQGMDWARPLARLGLRVIAMSRLGCLRTPRPADASPAALETTPVPTLVISARDDGLGTCAGAEYTASGVPRCQVHRLQRGRAPAGGPRRGGAPRHRRMAAIGRPAMRSVPW